MAKRCNSEEVYELQLKQPKLDSQSNIPITINHRTTEGTLQPPPRVQRPNMYPTAVDQNRPEALHLHMHQFCYCNMFPCYPPGYRPPLPPYPVPALPRPYNFHHFQYTQLNLGANNLPSGPPNPIVHSPVQGNTHQSLPLDVNFGPPPRDRRNLEKQVGNDSEGIPTAQVDKTKATCESRDPFLGFMPGSPSNDIYIENSKVDQENSPCSPSSTDEYTSFLEKGFIVGEKIAIKNQHRPCFKNIQNLCNRTRTDILKQCTTVSNIHSQGIPWATKDFIYAFVRLTNCWYILKGYLENQDGSLGKIEMELSPEFRSCYKMWEKDTRDLSAHLIEIFSKLDNNVSNPAPNSNSGHTMNLPPLSHISTLKNRNCSPQLSPKHSVQPGTNIGSDIPHAAQSVYAKELASLKGVRGILHIPQASSGEIPDTRSQPIETVDLTQQEDESDSEIRVYMKPGSYSIPKKHSSNNSPKSLDTAQTVAAYQRQLFRDKPPEASNIAFPHDKMWINAESTLSDLIHSISPHAELGEKSNTSIGTFEQFDSTSQRQQQPDVAKWIKSCNFDIQTCDETSQRREAEDVSADSSPSTSFSKPITLLQRSKSGTNFTAERPRNTPKNLTEFPESVVNSLHNGGGGPDVKIPPRTYRKRADCVEARALSKPFAVLSNWEFRSGGLTEATVITVEHILEVLANTKFAYHLVSGRRDSKESDDELEMSHPCCLQTISKKLRNRKYSCLNEVVHDFRHILLMSDIFYENRPDVQQELEIFREILDNMLEENFVDIDFSRITGDDGEILGPLIRNGDRFNRTADGDDDH